MLDVEFDSREWLKTITKDHYKGLKRIHATTLTDHQGGKNSYGDALCIIP